MPVLNLGPNDDIELNFRESFVNESVSLIHEFLGVLPVSNAGVTTHVNNIWRDIFAKDALGK